MGTIGWQERSKIETPSEKSEVVAFVGGLLDAIPADAGYDRWFPWLALAAAELQAPELRDRIEAMFDRGLVERQRLVELFDAIEPELHRFPAIEPSAFRAAVEAA